MIKIQVENNPYLPQHKLVKFCQDNGIQITAYCPLGRATNPNLLDDAIVKEVAKKNNMTPAQVVLSWNVQRNVIGNLNNLLIYIMLKKKKIKKKIK